MTVNLMDDGSVATISVLYSLFEASDVEFGIDALKLLADINIAKSGFIKRTEKCLMAAEESTRLAQREANRKDSL